MFESVNLLKYYNCKSTKIKIEYRNGVKEKKNRRKYFRETLKFPFK